MWRLLSTVHFPLLLGDLETNMNGRKLETRRQRREWYRVYAWAASDTGPLLIDFSRNQAKGKPELWESLIFQCCPELFLKLCQQKKDKQW